MQNIRKRALLVQEALRQKYPEPATHLFAESPWQLVVAVVLSAQCKDEYVNRVTPALFKRWPDAASLATASLDDVRESIRTLGLYNTKAKNIIAAAKHVMEQCAGEVPQDMQGLMRLPGVGRKTANVVLWTSFASNEGIAVDTHVGRISYRLGLTKSYDVRVIEQDLMQLFPRDTWGKVNHRMVWFGRDVCDARKPLCAVCPMQDFCPKVFWESPAKGARKAQKLSQK